MLPLSFRTTPSKNDVQPLLDASIHPVIANCLASRGVTSAELALLQQKLLPYRQLKGMKELAVGLAQAIINKEKMVVVADYDCDGATACVVAVSGLRALGADIDFVVPDRIVHGYGLTPSVVEVACLKNPKHIVTVDNGIASIDGVQAARDKGVQVWITDHHLPGPTTPNASGIVNPNQHGCTFPSKNLAGCGVMFYVLGATKDALKAMGHAVDIDISEWLDVVALGTVADVVKLDENNRWLVQQGLNRIRQGLMRPGIWALFEVSKRDWEYASASDFGFSLGPRLNAAGRLSDMSIGIRCLLATDPTEAMELAEQLSGLNEERKNIEGVMKEVAHATVETERQRDQFTRVVFGDDFHEGVIGIVAGRIKERDYAPTIVFAPAAGEPGVWKGSGRSIPSVHLRDALDMVYKKNPTWFVKFGGHAMAAGVTLRDEAKPHFAKAFDEVVATILDNQKPQQVLTVDGKLGENNLTVAMGRALSRFVWGQGFEEPTWIGEFVVEQAQLIGKDKNHLRMTVRMVGGRNKYTALHFNQDPQMDVPEQGQIVSLAYKLQASHWNGEDRLDLMIVDR